MTADPTRYQFTVEEISDLLEALDARLKKREISGSLFIVGGAAVALITGESPRRTEDVDALSRDRVIFEEAQKMAEERGLPSNWLNSNAGMWMPPLPPEAFKPHPEPGLHVTCASEEFLFATKLIAQRRKDAADLRLLADRLGLVDPSADELEAIILRYYTDRGALEMIIDGTDVDREIPFLAKSAAAMLSRRD